MEIRKTNYRMSERDLDFIGIMALIGLCKDASVSRIEHLVKLFNESPDLLEDYEKCFLINYVAMGRVESVKDKDYALYSVRKSILDEEYFYLSRRRKIRNMDNTLNSNRRKPMEKTLILSKEEYESKSFNPILNSENNIEIIIKDLEGKGFEFLETRECLLAFCEKRNIVLYANSIDEILRYYGKSLLNFFQQPYVTYDNRIAVSYFPSIDTCKSKKTDFALFSESNYLNLYNRCIDNDTPFNSSMKRIAKYPKLYNAVGKENQKLIDSIVQMEQEGYSRKMTK